MTRTVLPGELKEPQPSMVWKNSKTVLVLVFSQG